MLCGPVWTGLVVLYRLYTQFSGRNALNAERVEIWRQLCGLRSPVRRLGAQSLEQQLDVSAQRQWIRHSRLPCAELESVRCRFSARIIWQDDVMARVVCSIWNKFTALRTSYGRSCCTSGWKKHRNKAERVQKSRGKETFPWVLILSLKLWCPAQSWWLHHFLTLLSLPWRCTQEETSKKVITKTKWYLCH